MFPPAARGTQGLAASVHARLLPYLDRSELSASLNFNDLAEGMALGAGGQVRRPPASPYRRFFARRTSVDAGRIILEMEAWSTLGKRRRSARTYVE